MSPHVRKFCISKICPSAAIVIEPLVLLLSLPPLDAQHTLLGVVVPVATSPIATTALANFIAADSGGRGKITPVK
jgi:hypothetical protein